MTITRWQKGTIALILIVAFSNLHALFAYDLHFDEAFCWVWSRQLELSYFDHAPMVAYLIRIFTTIGGNSEFWVRLPAFLIWLFNIGAVYYMAERIYQNRAAGFIGMAIALFIPILTTGSHLIMPDLPMALFSILTWYHLYLAIEEEKKNAWYLAGLFFGLSLLSKYQAVLIAPAAFLYMLLQPAKRRLLRRKEPYLAVLLSLIMFLPVIYWSWQHDWANFLYQFGKGVQHEYKLSNLGIYLIGVTGVFSPLFLVFLGYAFVGIVKWRRITSADAFLIAGSLFIFSFFALTSLTVPAAPNWPSAAFFPAIVFLAGQLYRSFQTSSRVRRGLLLGVLGLSMFCGAFVITLVRYADFYFEKLGMKNKLPPSVNRTNEVYGWRELGAKTDAVLREHFPEAGITPIFADSYKLAAELDFYVSEPKVLFTTREAHRDMYDYYLMDKIHGLDGRGGLIALEGPLPASAAWYFHDIELVADLPTIRYGQVVRRVHLYKFSSLNAEALYEMARNKPLGYPGTYPD